MRLMVILFFPLMGLFDYLRMQEMYVLSFFILMFPLCVSIAYVLVIKPTLSARLTNPLRPFARMGGLNLAHAVLMGVYFLMVLVGFLRAINIGTREMNVGAAEFVIFFVLVFFFYAAVVDAIREGYYDSLLSYVGMSLFLLVLINLMGAATGISNPGVDDNYRRELTNLFGFTDYRIIFPFMSSGQMLSIQAGALVIFGIFRGIALGNRKNALVGLAMIVSGLVVLLGHGGRIAMAMLVGTLLFVLFWRMARRFLFIVLAVFLLFPVLVVFSDVGSGIEEITESLGVPISRHEGDISSFSNRDKIFAIIMLGHFSQGELTPQLVGNGAYGQVASGLSYNYAKLFETSYTDPDKMTAHNTVLQILVDYGFIGVGLFTLLVFNLARLVRRNAVFRKTYGLSNKNEKLLIALLLYMIGCSITEASISYFSFGVFSVFIALNMLILFDRASIQSKIDFSRYRVKLA